MPERKTVYTLNIGPYAPEITKLTYPLLREWVRRFGAELVIINARKFPEWPVVYEKLQIFELAQQRQDDWSIYVDSDALIHPDMPDLTELIPREVVVHFDVDMAAVRWTYDRFFRRDGRHIGSGNWFTIASSWCVDVWRPLDDLTLEEAVARIHPCAFEGRADIQAAHLIDDYVVSRNIAKYGLKVSTVKKIQEQFNFHGEFFKHDFLLPLAGKVDFLKKSLVDWKIELV